MKEVTFGVFYQAYGYVTTKIPDDVAEGDIADYIQDHWDEYPLPSGAEYIPGSDELDVESICIYNMGDF